MGAFYSSIQVRSDDSAAVKAAVEAVASECRKKFLLAPPLNGWIAAYPDDSGQDERCAALLAKKLDTIVLHLMVHDSDVFYYNFFRYGELLNEYSSDPDYFEEASAANHLRLQAKPELFQELVASSEKFGELIRLLARGDSALKIEFAEDRMERFAKILGIRNTRTSYDYLTQGDHDGVKARKKFVHIPDQADKKAAKKAKAAALLAEKQRMQKSGIFCVECLPKGSKRRTVNTRGEFCFDPFDNSLLVLWKRFGYPSIQPQWIRLQSPWTSGSQPIQLTLASDNPCDLMLSPRGKWLAMFDAGLKLWDWPQQKLVTIKYDGIPIQFSQDEKLLYCRAGQKFDTISTETGQIVHSVMTAARIERPAFHPSHKFMVTKLRQDQLGIVNLESGKVEKALFFGTKRNWSNIIPAVEGVFQKAGVSQKALDEWKTAFVGGSENILNLKFSPDGDLLFCGTGGGLRVLRWNEMLTAAEMTPEPLLGVAPYSNPLPQVLHQLQYTNYIYAVVFDELKGRLLFCGLEGVIRFLNLADATTGILLDPPGKSSFVHLQLSPDRKFIACLWGPPFEEHDQPWRIQVWNYQALSQLASLDWQ